MKTWIRTFLSFLLFFFSFLSLSRLLLLLRRFFCLSFFLLCRLRSEELDEELDADRERLLRSRDRSRLLLRSLSLDRERDVDRRRGSSCSSFRL